MLSQKLIEPSQMQVAVPIWLASRKDEQLHFGVGYRNSNPKTKTG